MSPNVGMSPDEINWHGGEGFAIVAAASGNRRATHRKFSL